MDDRGGAAVWLGLQTWELAGAGFEVHPWRPLNPVPPFVHLRNEGDGSADFAKRADGAVHVWRSAQPLAHRRD